jgi:hypothetical protein
MFVAAQVRAKVNFALAQARLARFAQVGGLLSASRRAYGAGLAGWIPVGPPGAESEAAALVRARFADPTADHSSARMPLRWEAIKPGGKPFPALDADLTLSPAGDQATTLMLIGVYRLPPGTKGNGLDQAVEGRIATTTIQAFLYRIAVAINLPGPASTWDGGITDQSGSPPAAWAP